MVKKKSVFESYPEEYDLMTDAAAREKNHALEVTALVDRFRPTSVLDAGCATGLTTRLFAERGVTAVGIDRARSMVKLARQRYDDRGLPLSFRYGEFERLPRAFDRRFGLVVCLANAIVGVNNQPGLKRALHNFARVLAPGGALVLQALNYKAIREGETFPVKATAVDGRLYLRMIRRRRDRLELTAIRVDQRISPPNFEPFVHEFRGFEPEDLQAAARSAGLVRIRKFGNLRLTTPFRKTSRDFVLVARKPD